MGRPIQAFDRYFDLWNQEICRLCLILCPDKKAAHEAAFQAFLRLGGAKNEEIAQSDAKMLLFTSALRICDDFYLKKLRKKPKREALAAFYPCPVTDALYALVTLPFPRRAALALSASGFSGDEISRMLRGIGRVPPHQMHDCDIPGWREALASVTIGEDDALMLSDRIYERFSERSVPVENAIHNFRSAFDRAAPFLALGVLAIFALALYITRPV